MGGDELLRHRRRAVEDGHRVAVAFHVEHEVLAHHGQPDQTNCCSRHDASSARIVDFQSEQYTATWGFVGEVADEVTACKDAGVTLNKIRPSIQQMTV